MKGLNSLLFGAVLSMLCMATGFVGLARAQEPPAEAPPVPSSLNYLPANKETYLKFASEVVQTKKEVPRHSTLLFLSRKSIS